MTLIDTNSKVLEEKPTDQNGNYDFVNVVSGTDTVTVKVSLVREGKTYAMPQYFARWYPARGIQTIPRNETRIPGYPEPSYGYVYGSIQTGTGTGANFINGIVYLASQDNEIKYYEFADRTDGKGSFSFYVPPGSYTLYAQHQENGVVYESTRKSVTVGRNVDMTDPNLASTSLLFPLTDPAQSPDPAEAPLHYDNKVSGTVATKDGKPWPRATVTLLQKSDNGSGYIPIKGSGSKPSQAVTDSNGYYQFNGVLPTTDGGKSIQWKKDVVVMVEYTITSGAGQKLLSEPKPLYYPDMIMGYGKEISARNVTLPIMLPISQAGWLNLSSVPTGAFIYVDGRQLYGPDNQPLATPATAYIDAGDHVIRMSKEGYQDNMTTVTMAANTETEFASMQLQKALVPPWVTVGVAAIVSLLAALAIGTVCIIGLYVLLNRKGN